jgi:hypothetical protein
VSGRWFTWAAIFPDALIKERTVVSINQCLKCEKEAEGEFYPFYVGKLHFGSTLAGRSPYRIIREEQAFICTRCAEARMRANAWIVIFGCTPLALAISLPLLAFSAWNLLDRPSLTPFAAGYSQRLLFAALGLLGAAVLFAWGAIRQLRYVRYKGYQHRGRPDVSVTWMAISLRKRAIIKELNLMNTREVKFFTEVDRRRLGM